MHHRTWRRGRVWKLTDPWTPRTRPPILAKPQNGFAQAPTSIINTPLQLQKESERFFNRVFNSAKIVAARCQQNGRAMVTCQPGGPSRQRSALHDREW